jgi:hypothetical protein
MATKQSISSGVASRVRGGILIAAELRNHRSSIEPAPPASPLVVASTPTELSEWLAVAKWWLGIVITGLGECTAATLAHTLRQSGRVRFVVAANEGRTAHLTPATRPSSWVLDTRQRKVLDLEMPPLVHGELLLLQFLGTQAQRWYTNAELCSIVYRREDPAARQLVWKYWSTLRTKLGPLAASDLQACRRRGYRCRRDVVTLGSRVGRASTEADAQSLAAIASALSVSNESVPGRVK